MDQWSFARLFLGKQLLPGDIGSLPWQGGGARRARAREGNLSVFQSLLEDVDVSEEVSHDPKTLVILSAALLGK